MKRLMILFTVLVCSNTVIGQSIRGVKTDSWDVSQYPQVSFIWNDRSAAALNERSFVIFENEIPIAASIKPLSYRNAARSHNILFLWEDHIQAGQFEFTKQLLLSFFEGAVNPGDKFQVASFERVGVDGKALLTPLLSTFTDNTDIIKKQLSGYKSRAKYAGATDLYKAVTDGAELVDSNGVRADIIVVITSGYNLNVSGAQKDLQQLKDRDVSIYVVQYPALAQGTPVVAAILEYGYGELVNTGHRQDAITQLKGLYGKMSERHYGRDYQITFTAQAPRDGKPHTVTLKVNGVAKELSFTTPDTTLFIWCEEHLVSAIVIGAVSIALIVLLITVICRTIKKHKSEKAQNVGEIAKLKKEAYDKEKEHKDAELRAKDAELRAKEENRQKELQALMDIQNRHPRLFYELDGKREIFTINSIVTLIGRENGDCILPKATVSRSHAKIIFNGTSFEICNLSKTNPTILNGRPIECEVLKSGDMIGIGEVILTVYM